MEIQDMPEAIALLTSESIPACTPSHSSPHAHVMPSYSQVQNTPGSTATKWGNKAERALVVAGLAVAPGVAAGVAMATGEDAVTAGEPAGLVDWAMGDAIVGDDDMPGLAGLADRPGEADMPGDSIAGDPARTTKDYALPDDA